MVCRLDGSCSFFPHRTVNTDILFLSVFSFSCASIALAVFMFSLCCIPLQVCHKCVSFSTGVILPVHCVCGLHHAAVLYAGRYHRQRPDLRLSYSCVECLPVYHSWSHGTSSVAGKVFKPKCALMVETRWYTTEQTVHKTCTHICVLELNIIWYLISIN